MYMPDIMQDNGFSFPFLRSIPFTKGYSKHILEDFEIEEKITRFPNNVLMLVVKNF